MMHQNGYGLDIAECKKSNVMISGLTGSGKTRLAWAHANELMRSGFQVIVVDPVGVWRDSSIPYIVRIAPHMRLNLGDILDVKSVVLDVSRLLIGQQLEFIDGIAKYLFNSRVDNKYPRQTMLVIEEVSTFVKNLRSEVAQNLYRLAFTGRNMGIRLTYIDPRLNSIPAEFRFLAGQQYIGYVNEVNVLNKIKRLYGKQWEQTVKTLKPGQFIRAQATQNPELIQVPLYTPTTKPRQITEQPKPQNTQTFTTQTYMKPQTQPSKFNDRWWATFFGTLLLFIAFWSQIMRL